MSKECPPTVMVKAIDVKPYRYAQWCSIGDGEPFANDIGPRRWSDDGEYIWFMLESYNFFKARPDEILELIPFEDRYRPEESLAASDKRDAEIMAKRPTKADVPKPCPACGVTSVLQSGGTPAKEGTE